jgi:hypothetical protein
VVDDGDSATPSRPPRATPSSPFSNSNLPTTISALHPHQQYHPYTQPSLPLPPTLPVPRKALTNKKKKPTSIATRVEPEDGEGDEGGPDKKRRRQSSGATVVMMSSSRNSAGSSGGKPVDGSAEASASGWGGNGLGMYGSALSLDKGRKQLESVGLTEESWCCWYVLLCWLGIRLDSG